MKYWTSLEEADPIGHVVCSCRANCSRKKTLLDYTRASFMESALSSRMRGQRAYFVALEPQYVLMGWPFDAVAEYNCSTYIKRFSMAVDLDSMSRFGRELPPRYLKTLMSSH